MEKYPRSASKHCTKIIMDQMENFIYKKDEKEKTFRLGFFCIIKYENKNIPVLISNNQILNEIIHNTLDISLNNQKRKIKLGDILYHNDEYNMVIIEIKEERINDLHFFEIDEKIYSENSEMYYSGESIYMIYYNQEEKDFSVSYGVINNINNSDLIYSCNIKSCSEISLIFNLSTNKIIGIYNCNSTYYIKGIFFKYFINEIIDFIR